MRGEDRKTLTGQSIRTEVITFRGIVQGVGFRPTVYRIAQQLGMKGDVRNMGGVVQIVCTGTPEEVDRFVDEINNRKPPMARISGVSREVISLAIFHNFSIGTSSTEEDEIALIPADIAICPDCLKEFYNVDNPRYKHPFISCTNCGPRYSILERLPYDRNTTTMVDFPMCELCDGEYNDPGTRRYHAQTISCHNCGPQPILLERGRQTTESSYLQNVVKILNEGGVLALKGFGGYYLICSPFDADAVQKLREIKKREQKPFAVMFRDVDQASKYCIVNEREAKALDSPERPIVLLESIESDIASGVNNTSRFTGAFLPSFGLQYLLIDEVGPLIMTSANISELPIITTEEDMVSLANSTSGIDGILCHERRIAAGLDDSVVRVIDGTSQLIRRSKGFVPLPVYIQAAGSLTKDKMIFAAGGHLKSVMAFSKGSYSYLSRFIGDMESLESENVYRDTFSRMKELFTIEPGLAVCDMHPNYFTTNFSESLGLPLLYTQHHHSHIASVMAEHGQYGPVIGIAFDGTGYGTDNAVWGGEVLICEGAKFQRFSHLKYVDMIGGDASVREGWKSAVSHLRASCMKANSDEFEIGLSEIVDFCKTNGTLNNNETALSKESVSATQDIPSSESIDTAEAALRAGVNTVKTSSMGRLFDAVSAMLGIHYENRYEGECAIMLENVAQRAIDKTQRQEMPTEQERLALDFHINVAGAILEQCRSAKEKHSIEKVCLSGGTFQNKILTEETLSLLRNDGFTVYYNIHVPPNDGGIALGQIYIGMMSVTT